jgi:hypothetical protein
MSNNINLWYPTVDDSYFFTEYGSLFVSGAISCPKVCAFRKNFSNYLARNVIPSGFRSLGKSTELKTVNGVKMSPRSKTLNYFAELEKMLKCVSSSFVFIIIKCSPSKLHRILMLKTLIYEGTNRITPLLTEFVTYVTKCVNTCATSYVTADNSRPMEYLILKVVCK